MTETPVVLFVFRRPETTKRVLDEIRQARARRLIVIADGPRSHHPDDVQLVQETRALFSSLDWDCQVTRIYSETNLGLRQRVISGLDIVFEEYDRAIILEDDCLPHSDFFRYAAELLDFHDHNESIGIISANNFAPDPRLPHSYYFATHAYIWGWATWRRTWHQFKRFDVSLPLDAKSRREVRSRLPGLFRSSSFLRLTDTISQLDSWAINFALMCHLNGLLTVIPKSNLVRNIGFGTQSTHTKFESFVNDVETQPMIFPLSHPREIRANFHAMKRESQQRLIRLVSFPVIHPIQFSRRVIRGIAIVSGSRTRLRPTRECAGK